MSYRRAPGDAAMNLRIQSILDHAGVAMIETDIWILLYPPEIYTTTMYMPSHASKKEVRALIHEQLFSNLSYPVHYDWENYALSIHDNGHGENMVTVTIMGKDVLPRIQELLCDNYERVNFLGDGLQFLNIEHTLFKGLRGQSYEMILPSDELYYIAAFRSGLHVESSVLTHARSSSFGDYTLYPQQVYMDIRQQKNRIHQPKIQPVASTREWEKARLTSAAFPAWFIARNSMYQSDRVNFIKQITDSPSRREMKQLAQKPEAIQLLD